MNWKRILFLASLFALWYCWPTEGQHIIRKPVEVSCYMKVCLAPCTIRVSIRIERHVDNRWLGSWWGDLGGFEEEGSEMLQLDENSPTLYYKEIEFRKEGNMMVLATLGRVDKHGKKSDFTDYVRIKVGGPDAEKGKKSAVHSLLQLPQSAM